MVGVPEQSVQGLTDNGLSFDLLRLATLARLPLFKNGLGQPAHQEPDGSDWSLSDWAEAVVGEFGELSNIMKKVRRGDLTMEDAHPAIRREFADIICYLDIYAFRAGVDLGAAVIEKFNEVSERVGAPIKLSANGVYVNDWNRI